MSKVKKSFCKIICLNMLFVLLGISVMANPIVMDQTKPISRPKPQVVYLPSYYAITIGATIVFALIAVIALIKIYKSNKNEKTTQEKKEENK